MPRESHRSISRVRGASSPTSALCPAEPTELENTLVQRSGQTKADRAAPDVSEHDKPPWLPRATPGYERNCGRARAPARSPQLFRPVGRLTRLRRGTRALVRYDHCTHTGGALGKPVIAPRRASLSTAHAQSCAARPGRRLSHCPAPHRLSARPGGRDPSSDRSRRRLPVGTESRDGYDRDAFRHWNPGANPSDGCNTRAEVLISEAVEVPAVGSSCRLTGGSWWSYYDQVWVTSASGLDIDHMVPLAESWDSGASAWTAQRREVYANDQGAVTSLVAVTARSNRSKADQDPAQWLPPAADVHCRYAAEWVARSSAGALRLMKPRWPPCARWRPGARTRACRTSQPYSRPAQPAVSGRQVRWPAPEGGMGFGGCESSLWVSPWGVRVSPAAYVLGGVQGRVERGGCSVVMKGGHGESRLDRRGCAERLL